MTSALNNNAKTQVCVGMITAAHGVRGLVKVKSYTQQARDFANFETLYDVSGKQSFRLSVVGESKGACLVQIDGVSDRNAAENLRGTKLYVPREELPETAENEYYHADLIGMDVKTLSGKTVGKIKAVFNFGAGDVLEIEKTDCADTEYLSFSKTNVPEVDLNNRFIVAVFPKSVIVKQHSEKDTDDDAV